jgi:hypothetical protein
LRGSRPGARGHAGWPEAAVVNRGGLIAAGIIAAPLVLLFIVVFLFLGGAGGGASAGTPLPAAASVGAVAADAGAAVNEALGAQLAVAFGWAGAQDTCLNELWTRESGWRTTAINPASGAYGIAQALGHAEGATLAMNKQGDNYPDAFKAANPAPWGSSDATAQINWGLGYIKSAYGSPCAAWNHETADGFY